MDTNNLSFVLKERRKKLPIGEFAKGIKSSKEHVFGWTSKKSEVKSFGVLIPEEAFYNIFFNASIQTDPLIYGLCMRAAFYHIEELSAGYYLGM